MPEEWLVRLEGHPFDLEVLSKRLHSANLNIRKEDDGHYYLRASDFTSMIDNEAVEERAAELLGYINRAATLQSGNYEAVGIDLLVWIDAAGKRHHFKTVSVASRARVSMSASRVSAEGEESAIDLSPQLDEIESLVILADQNEKVADALLFYERGDWINLYKAWEVVCDAAGGLHEVVKNGWATEPDRSRFTGTAQSRAELGDKARHASDRFKAPKDPMTLDEARAFVRSVIETWMRTL